MFEYELKNTIGPTTDRQVLKSTCLLKSLPKIPTLVGHKRQFKKFVLTLPTCIEHFVVYIALTLF